MDVSQKIVVPPKSSIKKSGFPKFSPSMLGVFPTYFWGNTPIYHDTNRQWVIGTSPGAPGLSSVGSWLCQSGATTADGWSTPVIVGRCAVF